MIRTKRLRLIPATVELLIADLAGPAALELALRVTVPGSWPPEFYDTEALEYTLERLQNGPDPRGWWTYYFIRDEPGQPAVVVGIGGYTGPPDTEGTVEVGYSVVLEYRRQGYATEATRGLVAHAFGDAAVQRVIAQTLPELAASIGVLEKSGFTYAGTGSDAGAIRYVLERGVYEAQHAAGRA